MLTLGSSKYMVSCDDVAVKSLMPVSANFIYVTQNNDRATVEAATKNEKVIAYYKSIGKN